MSSATGKRASFIVREEEPLNGGPPPDALIEAAVTPNDLFFVRNHGDVPRIDPAAYRLRIDGLVERPQELALDDLYAMPQREVVAALQCAGNRRREMEAIAPIPNEIIWDTEAVSCARWTGVPLARALEKVGAPGGSGLHVAFEGVDTSVKSGRATRFGGSIPLKKALSEDVLLAYAMNGEVLPPVHGYPLRVIVPGYIGARSVKWLTRITVQRAPSDNYYQQRAYKLFPPNVSPANADWSSALMLGELPVNAVICLPLPESELPVGEITVRGHALTGGGRSIARVDVSADGGTTWTQAALEQPVSVWALWRWETRLQLPAGDYELVARAWDTAANSQPERVESIWNFKGYMNNACHRVRIRVRG